MSNTPQSGGDPTESLSDPASPSNSEPTSTSSQPQPTEQPEQPDRTTQEPAPQETSPTTTKEPSPNLPSPTSEPPPSTSSNRQQDTQTSEAPSPDNNEPTQQSPAETQPTDSPITTSDGNPEGQTSTVVVIKTSTSSGAVTNTITSAPISSTTGVTTDTNDSSTGGLSTGGKIAVAVVVPIAVIAILFIVGLFFWRKRRSRKHEEEQRKQDLKDYAYNPNDPTIPPLAGDNAFEMKEDTSAGYRGWGASALGGSISQKASTTMPGGGTPGQPYSDMTNLIPISDTRSGEPIRSDGSASPEGEILGAMGPPASQNRGGDIRRDPSNASSHYSAGAGSEDSDGRGIGVAYSGSGYNLQQQPVGYEQFGGGNPYAENPYAFAPAPPPAARTAPGKNTAELGGQPVIRDNPSRRTTQIQHASHHAPQPGISQNF